MLAASCKSHVNREGLMFILPVQLGPHSESCFGLCILVCINFLSDSFVLWAALCSIIVHGEVTNVTGSFEQ
jgi:hypothetical protein